MAGGRVCRSVANWRDNARFQDSVRGDLKPEGLLLEIRWKSDEFSLLVGHNAFNILSNLLILIDLMS